MLEWSELQGLERRTDYIVKNAPRTLKPILEICDFERVKKGKIYKAGISYIQLSASDGKVRFLVDDKELEEKYGVFIPKGKDYICPRFIYYMLDFEMEEFLARYQCGMNINPDIFKFLKVTYYTKYSDQVELCRMLDGVQAKYDNELKQKDEWEYFKKYHLDGMFPNN